MGYNALYILKNFGTLCLTLFVGPICRLALEIISRVTKLFSLWLKAKIQFWNRMMRYNYWIGFLNETYLFLTVCACLNLNYLKWNTYGDFCNSFLSLLVLGILVAYPFFVVIFYSIKSNYKRILARDSEFLARYGSVISGLNFLRRERWVLLYSFLGFARKLWLAHIVVF